MRTVSFTRDLRRPARWLWLVVVGGLCLCALGAASAQDVVLTQLGHAGHGAAWTEFMEDRIAEFEKLHPNVRIERILAPGEDTTDKFLSMIAGGIAPDVTEMTLTRVGNLAPAGHFLNLAPFFERESGVRLTDFAAVAVNALTSANGELVGLPLDVWPTATYYNLDLFEEAGLAAPSRLSAADWDWEYVVEAGTSLTIDNDGDGTPEQWGVDTAVGLISYYIPMMQAGGSVYDRMIDPTRSTFTDEGALQGLEWVADLYRRGITAPDYEVPFTHGRSGMNFTSGPTTLANLASSSDFRFGTAPATQGPDNNGTYVAVNSVQITHYSKHPEMAWEWVKFLAGHHESAAALIQFTNRLTANLHVIGEFPDLSGRDPALIQPFIGSLQNPKSYHPALGPGIGAAEALLRETFFAKVVGENSPVRTTLESIKPQIDALIAGARK